MLIPTKDQFSSLPVPQQITHLARVDAKTRQELLLSRGSLDLVRALSPEMLFYTLKEIGLTDAVGLLAMASPEQVRDMMDLDCWQKDQLNNQRIVSWLMLLDEAGSSKLAEWVLHADIELLVLIVKRHFEVVRQADIEEDLDFDRSAYFTFDDHYLLRFLGEEEPILSLLLERLRVLDYGQYTYVLENSILELDSGLEEAELRWRNARLADRAYPEYEEAHELFVPVRPEALHLDRYERPAVRPLRFASGEELIPSDHALMLLEPQDSFLLRALAAVPVEDLEAISQELAALTNQVVIADGCDPGELSEVRRCVTLTHDTLNIGLAFLAEGDEARGVQRLHETVLRPIFQAGFGLMSRVSQQARALDADLLKSGLVAWETYLDTPFREGVAGAKRRPPLFFRGLETPGEILYRPFQQLADIHTVETMLAQLPIWFGVVHQLAAWTPGPAPEGVTLSVLWNTAFVHWVVDKTSSCQPVRRRDIAEWQRHVQGQKLEPTLAAFIEHVATQCHLTEDDMATLRPLAAFAQERLNDVMAVDAATIDLHYIEGLLVTGE
ncbi:MAG: hypothetical protein HOP18_12865 [Deltaproteobacteria bacterium]|nr:hypothetical protein [Deltaproteobacteria bacterium]